MTERVALSLLDMTRGAVWGPVHHRFEERVHAVSLARTIPETDWPCARQKHAGSDSSRTHIQKRSGTIELLYTRPLTDLQIILAKFLAGVVLVLLSLIPTLIYFYSFYQLGNPFGNFDIC